MAERERATCVAVMFRNNRPAFSYPFSLQPRTRHLLAHAAPVQPATHAQLSLVGSWSTHRPWPEQWCAAQSLRSAVMLAIAGRSCAPAHAATSPCAADSAGAH